MRSVVSRLYKHCGNCLKVNRMKIDKSSTTQYHTMGNGMCQRFNRTLCDMLGTLDPTAKTDWKTHVGSLVHAYNCTQPESIGYIPYYLIFSRHPRLPVDLALSQESQNPSCSIRSHYGIG